MSGPARLVALLAVATVLVTVGWWAFWFLCDDAFIAFRYVANSRAGFGYTWNPPPFAPVEGYTSFAWVVLLDAMWRGLGLPPTVAANRLSLIATWLTVWGAGLMLWRHPWPAQVGRWRIALVGLALLGIVSNRTVLAFASSGLETALFGLVVLAWLASTRLEGRARLAMLCLTGGVMPLVRPDGLLYLGATVVWVGIARRPARDLVLAWPLALPLAHVAWRRAVYGAWLPNTFHAKHLEPWPVAGLAYGASFALEYAVWLWLGLVGVVAWRGRHRLPTLRDALPWVTFAAHLGYYLLLVGGDHFEYRVLQPLVFVVWGTAAVWLAELLPSRRAVAALAVFVALSWPIPWVHWWHTHDLDTREATRKLRFAVAPVLPVSVVARGWDALQDWLIAHLVGVRHQTHKVFLLDQQRKLPDVRPAGPLDPVDVPVIAEYSVGWLGWALGDVAVLDRLGLNDAYVARGGGERSDSRRMAHELRAPDDYLRCFQPNVVVHDGHAVRVPRDVPLDATAVRACEQRFWSRLGPQRPAPLWPVLGLD